MGLLKQDDVNKLVRIFNVYINSHSSALSGAYQASVQAANQLWNLVSSKNESTETELQKKLAKCREYRDSIATLDTPESCIQLILNLAEDANSFQSDLVLAKVSTCSDTFHAARVLLISALLASGDSAVAAYKKKIEELLEQLNEQDELADQCISYGYPYIPSDETLLMLCNLSHEPSMCRAAKEGVFKRLGQAMPDPSSAPHNAFIPGVSKAYKVNMHYPSCYQKTWPEIFQNKYANAFGVDTGNDASSSSSQMGTGTTDASSSQQNGGKPLAPSSSPTSGSNGTNPSSPVSTASPSSSSASSSSGTTKDLLKIGLVGTTTVVGDDSEVKSDQQQDNAASATVSTAAAASKKGKKKKEGEAQTGMRFGQ